MYGPPVGMGLREKFSAIGGTYNSGAGVGLTNFHTEKPWRPPSKLLEADPPDHTPRRAVADRVMSYANLRPLRSVFAQQARHLVDRLLEKGRIDGVRDVAHGFETLPLSLTAT